MRIWLGLALLLLNLTPLWAQDAAPDLPAADALTPSGVYADSVLAYLNAGGDLETLYDALVSRGLILPEDTAADLTDFPLGGVWAADVTGDGCDDVLVNVGQAPDPSADYSARVLSVVWLLVCQDAEAQTPSYALGDWRSMDTANAILERGWHVGVVADLTQDGADDFVMHWVTCGAHTCFNGIQVMTWDADQAVLVAVLKRSVPYGSYRAEDIDDDGLLDLMIEINGIGSAGAGPQRPVTEVYSGMNDTLTLVNTMLPPPQYRFQAAYDGIAALNSGDIDAARAAFAQLRDDDALLTFSFNDHAYRDAVLDAVAVYGLLYADAKDGADLSAYQAQIDALPPTLPLIPGQDAPDANLWRAFSQTLLDALIGEADLAAACAVVQDHIARQHGPDTLWPTYWLDFGYAHAAPTPTQLCPAVQDD